MKLHSTFLLLPPLPPPKKKEKYDRFYVRTVTMYEYESFHRRSRNDGTFLIAITAEAAALGGILCFGRVFDKVGFKAFTLHRAPQSLQFSALCRMNGVPVREENHCLRLNAKRVKREEEEEGREGESRRNRAFVDRDR